MMYISFDFAAKEKLRENIYRTNIFIEICICNRNAETSCYRFFNLYTQLNILEWFWFNYLSVQFGFYFKFSVLYKYQSLCQWLLMLVENRNLHDTCRQILYGNYSGDAFTNPRKGFSEYCFSLNNSCNESSLL